MKLQTLVLLASTALAAPLLSARQYSNIDIDILQYALTLEHLENVFYKHALSSWPEQAFLDAGFSKDFYSQLKYIAHDEEGHVVYLEAGLKAAGATPNAACEYKFPMTDPKSFVALASVIEGVGVSAYLGAAADITSKAYLTAAGAILVTEALHQAAERNAVGELPMANVLATPLGLNAVYSIASQFIVSCPASNMALSVHAYPVLTATGGMPTAPGAVVSFSTKASTSGAMFVTFVSGLDVAAVPVTMMGEAIEATVPMQASGQSYAFLTMTSDGNLTDASIVAGPAILEVTASSPTFDLSVM
ncbi:hypothetical protein LTR66_004618 [Elasticomyces elasticus]|nr:hypothetical protein LTR50_007107 [Elasticomyces elasticus]KAK4995589.1 hypothetical protein LTR66_004618 [Elasticomyces elasticus]